MEDWKIGEEELKLFMKYIDKIIESVEMMKKSVTRYCGDLSDFPSDKKEKVTRLEREADDIKQRIMIWLTESDFQSRVKENFVNLLFVFDEIPENSRATVAKLSFLSECKPGEDIKKDLEELTENADKIVKILKEAISDLLMKDFGDSIEKSKQIEAMEEKVDQLRRTDLNSKILTWAEKEPNPALTGLFLDMIENIEEVVDQAERAANIIRIIAIGQI
ncbi:hypothetical protein AKJ62_00895 [candidate division MSBL1 archaeon SCGC-AAA259D14]|uniref:Phosphate transport regulator n=2 Tax=candidate division MSBL1 TaxID=215777 RepID=A0A133U897_9EURY|nr:hypothetical protein AKJ62_00895 [candidate division MSBL1 archaeon SCGC-AAA259D14]KXA93372.1 hypothetical protein AKJ66_02105 [candidate division MSBL1 archaeon SCGC-AAA259E22]